MRQENTIKLISLLKTRLGSSGKVKTFDSYGNTLYIDHNIYSVEMLETFLELSVSSFNQTPYFTMFTLDDDKFVTLFAEILVEGATTYALASQALIERGREFTTLVDGSITFDLPTVSEMLNTQYCTLVSLHWEKLKTIKNHKIDLK